MRVLLAPLDTPALLMEYQGEVVLILNDHCTPKPLAATLRRLLGVVDAKLPPHV